MVKGVRNITATAKIAKHLHGKKLKETVVQSMHALRTFEKNGRAVASFRYPGACLQRDNARETWICIPISRNPFPALNREYWDTAF